MPDLPVIRSHDTNPQGFTTYFDDVQDHRLEAKYEDRDGKLVPRHFDLLCGNRSAAHFVLHDDGEIVFTWNRATYTAERIRPFLASILQHNLMVDLGHLPTLRSTR